MWLATVWSPVLAQERNTQAKLGPRSFFPQEYTAEYFLDADALQDTDIWDSLERSALAGPMRMMFRRTFGFRLDDIVRVRATARYLGDKECGAAGPREVTVTVIEGPARKVCLPPIPAPQPGEQSWLTLQKKTIAGHDVVREAPDDGFGGWQEGRLYVMPQPGCLVIGSEAMIESVLRGQRRGGVISSSLMALTAMRKPLAYVAMGFPPPDDPRYHKTAPFDPNWLDEDDPVEHLIARLEVGEKAEQFSVRATVRFKNGKKGPARLEEGLKGQIEAMKDTPVYPLMKGFFDKVSWRRDGEDLHVILDLGNDELGAAFGIGGVLPYFLLSTAVPAPPVLAAPAPPPVPAVPVKRLEQGDAKQGDAKQGDTKKGTKKGAAKSGPGKQKDA